MAQIESPLGMGFDGLSSHNEDGTDEKAQTQKFIKIITTFASRVDVSVCKAQVTIDILLQQFNLPLTPKEVVEDNSSSSKIKTVMAVIKRAAILQRDVDRLGQLLVNRSAQQNPYAAQQQQQVSNEDQLELFEADVLITQSDIESPQKQQEQLVDDIEPPQKQVEELANGVVSQKQQHEQWVGDIVPPKQEEQLAGDIVPPQKQQEPWVAVKTPNPSAFHKFERSTSPARTTERGLSPPRTSERSLSPHRNLSPPKNERVLSPSRPEGALSPPPRPERKERPERPERAFSPGRAERALSPGRALSPKQEDSSPPTPKKGKGDNDSPTVPKKEIAPRTPAISRVLSPSPPAINRVLSPSPPKSADNSKPSTTNVSNLKALFRDMNLYHDPTKQVAPSSPKTPHARQSPVPAGQMKPNSSLLAKSLSASVISNTSASSPPSNALAKQTSFSGGSKVAPPAPKQYAGVPPPPSNSASNLSLSGGSPSPSSSPLSNSPSTPPGKSPFGAKKAAAATGPPRVAQSPQSQSSPALMSEPPSRFPSQDGRNLPETSPARAIPLSPRATSPTPPPPSLPASSSAGNSSFLSSTPPPSAMVKAVLKGVPLKKSPIVSPSPPSVSASPPTPLSATPSPPANGIPKRPARSGSNSSPLHSSFEFGTSSSSPSSSSPARENSSGAINIAAHPHHPDADEPIPLSSSASAKDEPLTDDSNHPQFDTTTTDDDTTASSFYSQQSTTPPSSLNIIPTSENSEIEHSANSGFSSVSLDDPATAKIEIPTTSHVSIADDLDDLELDDEDDSSSEEEGDKKKKKEKEKFDSVVLKKDINALLDEIDKEIATPSKKVNPGIKDMLSPFFTKRPKNKQEMETDLKDKGIVPRDEKKKREKH